jgi:glucose dehydrogenase
MAQQDWFMFHGDPAHTGEVTDSQITSQNVSGLQLTFSLNVPGSILSTPAVVDGYIYVGLANSHRLPTSNGGSMLKVNIETGVTEAQYDWPLNPGEGDSHGFYGMGCTPAVVDGKVYFSAFNGKMYCLNASDLTHVWDVDLRNADPYHNQPVANLAIPDNGAPKAAGWSSPVVANGKVYAGFGEGENPVLFAFVYCIDAATGDVIWMFSTCQYTQGVDNEPNVIPASMVPGTYAPGYTTTTATPVALGCAVWSGIAYDAELDALYCSTGNPADDSSLPSYGYSNGLLILDATSGAFRAFIQFPPESSYRPSDIDVDVGGAPTIYTITKADGSQQKVIGVGCKNGSYMIVDAATNKLIRWQQMLPKMNDGTQIPTVDPHGIDDPSDPNPPRTNAQSNAWLAENYHGTYSTAAICSSQKKLFIGIGGNNYHYVAAGIDTPNTPFIKAMDWETLAEAWPLDDGDPQRYKNGTPPLYTTAGESGISVPAVVNDVVFMATTYVALYAFSAADGTLLWQDQSNFGSQTGGMSGGYGYCIGPAIWGNYVVAGALVAGAKGGALNIYKLPTAS